VERLPKQIEHTPEVQSFLDRLEELLSGPTVEAQEIKNLECALEAGSVKCLNAASDMCNCCEWWLGMGEADDE
jgi:hypothetical protein